MCSSDLAQDPLVQQLIGQNPQAQAIQAALAAHIAEHVGYAYRVKMEAALGVQLPLPDEEMPEDMEREVSKMLAMAAPQVLAQSQAMVAQQQAQQNAQDPIIQLQMQELQIKKQDSDTKAKKVMVDAAAAEDKLEIERQRLALEQQKNVAKNEIEGFKLAGDVVKTRQTAAKPAPKAKKE